MTERNFIEDLKVAKGIVASICLAMVVLTVPVTGCASKSSNVGPEETTVPFELTLETDKASYQLEEVVVMRLTITNKTSSCLSITFPSAQRYDFAISKEEEEIWRWSRGRMFAMVVSEATVDASQSLVYEETWPQKDNAKNHVSPGTYRVAGVLKADPVRVSSSVIIEIKAN